MFDLRDNDVSRDQPVVRKLNLWSVNIADA
jgi:hypothetical protein